jgi:hypothetical protein
MKTRIAAFCALLLAGAAGADPYSMAIQQARRTSDQNAAEQQQVQKAAGSPGQSGAGASTTPVDPALQATLSNISGLQTDLGALTSSTADKPDPMQRISLLNNLSSAAQGTKASSDSVKKLADDLLTAVSGRKQITSAQQIRLARDIHALFNSSHLSDAQQKLVLDDVQKTLTDGGVSLDAAVDVVTDLRKISSETK